MTNYVTTRCPGAPQPGPVRVTIALQHKESGQVTGAPDVIHTEAVAILVGGSSHSVRAESLPSRIHGHRQAYACHILVCRRPAIGLGTCEPSGCGPVSSNAHGFKPW